MLMTALSTLFALAVLVSVHEAGHYFVARFFGVKVLRFSVGFGKPIYTKIGLTGTEYVFGWLPLGGYVRMLDSRAEKVPSDELEQAFDLKSPWKRIAIVAAGPLVNLIFAGLLYGVIQVMGTPQLTPIAIAKNDAVQDFQEPHQILAIDGSLTPTWEAVNLALAKRMGETTAIEFSLQRLDQAALQAQSELANELDVLPKLGSAFVKSIDVANWMSESSTQSPLAQLELDIWRPSVPVILDRVVEGSAAQKAGLQPADQVIAVNNKPMPVFEGFVDFVQQRPDESIVVTVLRNNQQLDVPVDLQSYTDPSGALIGSIGIGVQSISWPTSIVFEQQLGLFDGLVAGFGKSLEMAKLTFGFIVQLVKGLVSIDHLSGPISIVKIASASAESGLITYLAFMAYLSVSLGVLNLLPVPMLDGGHLIYYLIEAATGKKVPDSIQAIGLRIGMVLVFSVMIVAIINDLLRL